MSISDKTPPGVQYHEILVLICIIPLQFIFFLPSQSNHRLCARHRIMDDRIEKSIKGRRIRHNLH